MCSKEDPHPTMHCTCAYCEFQRKVNVSGPRFVRWYEHFRPEVLAEYKKLPNREKTEAIMVLMETFATTDDRSYMFN